jgi:hypothetical protein
MGRDDRRRRSAVGDDDDDDWMDGERIVFFMDASARRFFGFFEREMSQ